MVVLVLQGVAALGALESVDHVHPFLAAYPTAIAPPLGSLEGVGLYQSQLIYSLSGATLQGQLALFGAEGGLIESAVQGTGTSAGSVRPAWEEGLWRARFDRNDAIRQWGRALNVVVSDGIEHGGYVAAVVEQNAGRG